MTQARENVEKLRVLDAPDIVLASDNTTFTGTNTFSGAVALNGTVNGAASLAEYISDTAGAMFTGNTETGIVVTYQDSDNTIDLAVQFASEAEVLAGVVDNKAVTPATLQSRASPCGVIYRSGTQSGFGGLSKIQFNAVDFDSLQRGSFNTTSSYRYTVGADACKVLVIARVFFSDFDSAETLEMLLRKNGTTTVGYSRNRNDSGASNLSRTLEISKILNLEAGEYIEVLLDTSGTNITLFAGREFTSLEIVELT